MNIRHITTASGFIQDEIQDETHYSHVRS